MAKITHLNAIYSQLILSGVHMLNEKFLDDLEKYLKSGKLEKDFECSSEERRLEILDYLERLMDLSELADETATKIIFKNTELGQMFEVSAQK